MTHSPECCCSLCGYPDRRRPALIGHLVGALLGYLMLREAFG